MDDNDRKDFATAITALFESHGQQATKPILYGYWLGLQDLTLEAVQFAVALAMRQCERVPKPVELRRLAGEQTNEQRAIEAWGEALKHSSLGSWKHVDFQDKLINATIRNLGGWPMFLTRLDGDKQQEWARVNFIKTYQAFAASGVNGEAIAALPGLSEATSVRGVVQAPVPVRIACSPDRARLPTPMRQVAIETKPDVPKLQLHTRTRPRNQNGMGALDGR